MLTLLSELKFMNSRDDELNVKDTDFGVFKYLKMLCSLNMVVLMLFI